MSGVSSLPEGPGSRYAWLPILKSVALAKFLRTENLTENALNGHVMLF